MPARRAPGWRLRPGRRGWRGRARSAPAVSAPGAPPRRARTPWWRIGALALALAMFAQTFQYLIDVGPLYALSKLWPVLTLPLYAWGLARLALPYRKLLVATLGWVLGVAPVMSVIQLGNSLPDAFATTVKAWCFTFPIAGAAALALLRPSPRLLRRMLLGLGAALFAGLVIVWLLAPNSAYMGEGETKLFMYDDERGPHLFMPMFFGLLLVFALNRAFWLRPNWWRPAAIACCLWVLLVVHKERATIAGAAAVLAIGGAAGLPRRWRPAGFAALALLGAVGALALLGRLQSPDLNQSLGGSLSIRRNSVATAFGFLGADPVRWLFGVGATTRVGAVDLGSLLRNHSFFLADIGWLGIVFEYGLVGATLIALTHLAALAVAYRSTPARDPVAMAIGDYALYVLLVSPIYSVMFTPGEAMTCFALAWHMGQEGRQPAAPA